MFPKQKYLKNTFKWTISLLEEGVKEGFYSQELFREIPRLAEFRGNKQARAKFFRRGYNT